MNKDDNSLSLEDEKISKLSETLQKEGKKDFKSALANAGVEVMPQASDSTLEKPADKTNGITDEVVEEESTAQSIIKSLRTYERDVADTIRGGETMIGMKIAEQKRSDEKAKSSETREVVENVARGGLLFIISGVLIFTAIITLGVTFYFRDQTKFEPVVVERTIISVDSEREIFVDSLDKSKISLAVQNTLKEKNADGSFTEISLKKNLLAGVGKTDITADEFFKSIGTNAPSALSRSFTEKWLFGFHNLNTSFTGEPFIIVGLDSFDNAYDSMLGWESKMFSDIASTFMSNEIFASTTINSQFEDLVVKSRDTRVLKNIGGKIVLLYSFIDSKNLVITTNEETFREIVNRYLASSLIR